MIADVMKQQSPCRHQRSPVLEHGLDLGHQLVVGVECLQRTEVGFGLKGLSGRHRVDGVGLVEAT